MENGKWKMENKTKERFQELQHLCLDIGRAYVLLSSLQIHSDDLKDTMGDYIRWLKLCDEQRAHNADAHKLDHINEWMQRSNDICSSKHKYLQRIVVYLITAIESQSRVSYILNMLFGEENWEKAVPDGLV